MREDCHIYRIPKDQKENIFVLLKVRYRMITDAEEMIKKNKMVNPDLFLWDRYEKDGGYIMGWFIGDALKAMEFLRKQKGSAFERIKVNTSVRSWGRRLKDHLKERLTGEKPDPRTLDPYVR